MRSKLLLLSIVLAASGCQSLFGSDQSQAPALGDGDGGVCNKIYSELSQLKVTPTSCDTGCPTGSHCVADQCDWDCINDSDCGFGYTCSCDGYCQGAGLPDAGPTGDLSCPRDLDALNAALERACVRDENCPYGSSCDPITRRCSYECLGDTNCATGEVCDCRGLCAVPGAEDPGPPLARPTTAIAPDYLPVDPAYPMHYQTLSIVLSPSSDGWPSGAVPRARIESHTTGVGIRASVRVAEQVHRYGGVAFSTEDEQRAVAYLAARSSTQIAGLFDVTIEQANAIRTAITADASLAALVGLGGVDRVFMQAVKNYSGRGDGVVCDGAPWILDGDDWVYDATADAWRASFAIGRCGLPPAELAAEVSVATYLVDEAEPERIVMALDYRTIALAELEADDTASTAPGAYRGVLVDPAAGLAVSVEALVTDSGIVFFDRAGMLTSSGWFAVGASPTFAPVLGDGSRGRITARISSWAPELTGDGRRGTFAYELGGTGRVRVFQYLLARTGELDDLAPACACGAGTGTTCEPITNRCVPEGGVSSLQATLEHESEQAWRDAAAFLPAAFQTDYSRWADHAAAILCHSYEAALPAFMWPAMHHHGGITERTGDSLCVPNLLDRVAWTQTAVPLAAGWEGRSINNLPMTPVIAEPATTGALFEACMTDLRRDVPAIDATLPVTDQAQALLGEPGACVNLAQLFPVLGLLAHGDPAADLQLYEGRVAGTTVQRLLAQWLAVHAFVLHEGQLEEAASRALIDGGDAWSPPALEEILARAAAGWDLVLDGSYRELLTRLAPDVVRSPDYRIVRPVAYYTFDSGQVVEGSHVVDEVGNHPLDFTGGTIVRDVTWLRVNAGGRAAVPAGGLAIHGDVTLSFWAEVSSLPVGTSYIVYNPGAVIVALHKLSDGRWRVMLRHGVWTRYTDYRSDIGWRHLSVTRLGRDYSVTVDGALLPHIAFAPTDPQPVYTAGDTFLMWAPSSGALRIDELAIWDKALVPATITDIYSRGRAARGALAVWREYGFSLPLVDPADPNHEQGVGLPVVLVETAAEHARAVRTYARRRLPELYDTCYAGGASSQLARAVALSSEGLRYTLAAETLADELHERAETAVCTHRRDCLAVGAAQCVAGACVNTDGSPFVMEIEWAERYAGARTELAVAREEALAALDDLRACENPLGIPEDDLPLYFGDVVGDNGRFFASSDYLMDMWARPAVGAASGGLEAARSAYLNQRDSEIRQLMTEHDAERRLEQLELAYVQPAIDACGIDEHDPLDVMALFEAGTELTLDTCYVQPGCDPGSDSRECLRGSLGDAVLQMKAAYKALETERHQNERRLEEWAAQIDTCRFVADTIDADLALIDTYIITAASAREKSKGMFGDVLGAAGTIVDFTAHVASGGTYDGSMAKDLLTSPAANDVLRGCAQYAVTSDVEGARDPLTSCLIGGAMGMLFGDRGALEELQKAKDMLDAGLAASALQRELRNCYDEIDRRARDVVYGLDFIKQRALDFQHAGFRFDEIQRHAHRQLVAGRAALDREASRTVPSIAHHYWLDERITTFERDMERARRFTYLAMRAVEYEFQQSLGLRSEILTAAHPDELLEVLYALDSIRGTRTINARRPADGTEVLSLRSDILRLRGRYPRGPGERSDSATRRFQDILMSSEYAVYSRDGAYLGQGLPFSLDPVGALENRCAERVWRVTATIQGDITETDEPGAHVYLLKNNLFGSQWCTGLGEEDAFQQASTAGGNLFLGEAAPADGPGKEYTPALMYPWFNVRRGDFYRDAYVEGASDELGGRGLYGEYVLLFPYAGMLAPDADCSGVECDPFRHLSQIEDVLIRFDYYSVDDLPLP